MGDSSRSGKRTRLDLRLVELGLCESRSKAQAQVLAGQVLVDGQRVDKPGNLVAPSASLSLKQQDRYVSRGGTKLEGALEALGIDPVGLVWLDVGASTGGFTDCLLQRGATKVYAVDVGHGLLAHKLTVDPRVVVMDRTNARYLERDSLPEQVDFAVVDASFIGITQLIGALAALLAPGTGLLYMVKPQFEVGREIARKAKGVISNPEQRQTAIEKAIATIEQSGFEVVSRCDSKLAGPKGNLEHFVSAKRL